QPAQRVIVAALHRSGDFDGPDLARQRRQHGLALEAGDQLADAHVNAGAVADVAAGPPRDVVAVWVFPAARIAVGRAEEHQNLLALADAMAADLDLPRRGAEERLHRALEPHGFLERVARQREVLAQPRQLVGIARQAIDGGADAVDRGIEAGRQQRTYQKRRLGLGDIAGIDPRMDAGAEPAGCEVFALALFGDIGLM